MHSPTFLLLLLALPIATSSTTFSPNYDPETGKYTLTAPGIAAQFIPYGASITNLFFTDVHNVTRDVVLGFDNSTQYRNPQLHDHYGGVPGRYANRIRNATFRIDHKTYRVDANENGGLNTLHGGSNGWDWRDWKVIGAGRDWVSFGLQDEHNTPGAGFPGDVVAQVTYRVRRGGVLEFVMKARSLNRRTPIMLTSHTYWNLDGFGNDADRTVLEHMLHMPLSKRTIGVDRILVPTGEILPIHQGTVNDFWSRPKAIGKDYDAAMGNCGPGCRGYDNAFVVDKHDTRKDMVLEMRSPWSGIRMRVWSEQEGLQIYSCPGQPGNRPLKKSQGEGFVQRDGCIVVEVQDWIDGINHPEWGRTSKQIWGPRDGEYILTGRYVFDII